MKIHEYNEMMAYLTRPATGVKGERQKLRSGYLAGGAKDAYKKYYKGSTLESLLENPKVLASELGLAGIDELFKLFGLYAQGGKVVASDEAKQKILTMLGKKK